MEVFIVIYLLFNRYAYQLPLSDDVWSVTNQSSNRSNAGRVLNFFPLFYEEECKSTKGGRIGICMNTYECKLQNGKSDGFCGSGFGVCCLFCALNKTIVTATCNDEVANNITYFMSPDFPELYTAKKEKTCKLQIKKVDQDVSQIRIDFIHFNLAQPNRKTGICDSDSFEVIDGNNMESTQKICGSNNGHHSPLEHINITMNLRKRSMGRLWEMKITQMYTAQKAPTGCYQYHTGKTGTIQTMNFADNGRHLANQDYKICVRSEPNMCSIVYELCDENSFKLGGNQNQSLINIMTLTNGNRPILPIGSGSVAMADDSVPYLSTGDAPQSDQSSPNFDELSNDGSGDGSISPRMADTDDISYNYGSNYRQQLTSKKCNDKIVMPCESEHFLINPGTFGVSFCDVIHCGNTFCPFGLKRCRLESTIKPFLVGIQFGSANREESPDDNLGLCLRYEQQSCVS